jgi:hypothetical protein
MRRARDRSKDDSIEEHLAKETSPFAHALARQGRPVGDVFRQRRSDRLRVDVGDLGSDLGVQLPSDRVPSFLTLARIDRTIVSSGPAVAMASA